MSKYLIIIGFLTVGLVGSNTAVSQQLIPINEGLSGAWFNSQTPGQGFVLDINDQLPLFFAGWFTYDQDPSGKAIGADEQNWFVIQGAFSGNTAELPLFLTSEGLFDNPAPVQTNQVGTVTVSFSSCTQGRFDYQFDEAAGGNSGGFDIERITPDTFCQQIVGAQLRAAALTYIDSEGVFISDGEEGVLIDAVGDFGTFFVNVPAQTQTAIVNAQAPYDQTITALVADNHGDHDNITPLINFMSANTDAQLFISPQGRGAFSTFGERAANISLGRFSAESRIIGNTVITTIATRHFNQFGNHFSSVDHYVYLVEMSSKRILHLGDFDYASDNFQAVHDAISGDVDVIIIPAFNTLLGSQNAVLVAQLFPQAQVVAAHTRASHSSDLNAIQQFYRDAIIFDLPMELIEL